MPRRCKLDSEEFDLLGIDELTLGETIELQRIVNLRGMRLMEAAAEQDPEVTLGVLFLSIRRQRADVTLDELGDHTLTDFQVVEDEEEEEGGDPPTSTPEADGASGGSTSDAESSPGMSIAS